MTPSIQQLQRATERVFSRSSGPGGQNVNKTSTKVQLTFDILNSEMNDIQKKRLLAKFPNGFIRIVNQNTRSQVQNTRLAFEQLQDIIKDALKTVKKRTKTKAPHETALGKKRKMRKDKLLKYRQRNII